MSSYAQEVRSQPGLWPQASALATTATHHLPPHGARLAVAGCGTSQFIADDFAQLREGRGHGETDAFVPTADRVTRAYEAVLARSGTTTEVTSWLEAQAPLADGAEAVLAKGAPFDATVWTTGEDPMVELVRVHLQAEVEAAHRGRDVDNPPLLSRSVILS